MKTLHILVVLTTHLSFSPPPDSPSLPLLLPLTPLHLSPTLFLSSILSLPFFCLEIHISFFLFIFLFSSSFSSSSSINAPRKLIYRYLHIHEFKHTPSLFSSCFSFSYLILFSLEIHFTSTLRPASPVYFSSSSNSTSSFYYSSSISCKLIFFQSLFKVLHCLSL